jgi:hypothetical protein
VSASAEVERRRARERRRIGSWRRSMAEVLAPAEFNERFTLYLDHESKPVERT